MTLQRGGKRGSRRIESKTPLGQDQILMTAYGVGATNQAGTANRVWLTPVWVPTYCTVDEIMCLCITASAGQNFRMGLYGNPVGPNNASSPLGLTLLGESGNISSAATGPLRWTPAAPIVLQRGYVWVALATSDAVMGFGRTISSTFWTGTAYTMLEGCFYLLGGWGGLTDPCPAVTSSSAARQAALLHTVVWKE